MKVQKPWRIDWRGLAERPRNHPRRFIGKIIPAGRLAYEKR